MNKVMTFLTGKKTYAVVIVAIVFNTLVQFGYLNASDAQYINVILGALGLGALRAGVNSK